MSLNTMQLTIQRCQELTSGSFLARVKLCDCNSQYIPMMYYKSGSADLSETEVVSASCLFTATDRLKFQYDW